MAEYIDKEIALSLVQPDAPEDEKSTATIATAKKLVRSIIYRTPTADVAPVRHGRWKRYGKNLGECSECGEIVSVRNYYCPNCGAQMDEPLDESKR